MAVAVIDQQHGQDWTLYNGDSCEVLQGLPDHSIDLSIYSPPFGSLYTYTPSDRDLGNVKSPAEFWAHFSWVSEQLLRLVKPGRLMCVHVANLPTYETRDGVSGRMDFRGQTIRHFQEAGFVYHSEITIDKDAQAQAIRNHSKGLLFVQKRRDQSWLWQAWADYLVVFRAPGKNTVKIEEQLTDEEWIQWARPVWYGIRETDVLDVAGARGTDDERHLCPLQLPVIDRCLRLWSNPGEVVLSPFAGIGSEGYQSLLRARKFVGVELKPEYFRAAVRNLRNAEAQGHAASLLAEGAAS